MAYVRRRWVAHHRRYIVEDKYHTQRMMPEKRRIRERRRPRTGLGTSKKQAKINARQRAERLSRLILDNFEPGDWYVTFTLDADLTEDAVKTAYGKMTRELRRWYKKQSVTCKYIAVLENLKNGGRKHGHILLPAVPGASFQEMRRALKKAWPQGDVYLKPYAGEVMDAFRLASYYVKEEVKSGDGLRGAGCPGCPAAARPPHDEPESLAHGARERANPNRRNLPGDHQGPERISRRGGAEL